MKYLRIGIVPVSILLIGSFLFMSCATLFHGSTDTVSFASSPTGAQVYVNGMQMGTTPVQLSLKSSKTYTIEFRLDGYMSRTVILNSSIMAGFLILDVLFGVIPVIVDAATGNWLSLDQSVVNAPLQPASK